jgi:hypothetical protein
MGCAPSFGGFWNVPHALQVLSPKPDTRSGGQFRTGCFEWDHTLWRERASRTSRCHLCCRFCASSLGNFAGFALASSTQVTHATIWFSSVCWTALSSPTPVDADAGTSPRHSPRALVTWFWVWGQIEVVSGPLSQCLGSHLVVKLDDHPIPLKLLLNPKP